MTLALKRIDCLAPVVACSTMAIIGTTAPTFRSVPICLSIKKVVTRPHFQGERGTCRKRDAVYGVHPQQRCLRAS